MSYMYTIPNHTRNNSPAKLFYLSFQGGQMAVCFSCGGALFEWKVTDIPFIEHAKLFTYCPYIRYVKGHVFTRDHRPDYRTQID